MLVSRYDFETEGLQWFDVTPAHTSAEPLTFNYGGPHEEGYSYTCEQYWTEPNGTIICLEQTQAKDCDGRLDTERRYRWHKKQWQRLNSSQRDHNAERAGY